jgi:GAF domain-containing protein
MSFLCADSDRRFAPDDVALAQEIADRAALAIENAQLYRDTRRAMADRQRSEERQRLLAEISKLLESSLDYEATLHRLAKLAVQRLADWCVVEKARRVGAFAYLSKPFDLDRLSALVRGRLEDPA